jgi:hypothetical protein
MKKPNKPVTKAPAEKTSAIKRSAAKPKTKSAAKPKPKKAQGQTELMHVIARLEAITKNLAQTAERLTQIVPLAAVTQPLPPAEVLHPHTDEHADDVEVASVIREE